jgi:hypothetical protein
MSNVTRPKSSTRFNINSLEDAQVVRIGELDALYDRVDSISSADGTVVSTAVLTVKDGSVSAPSIVGTGAAGLFVTASTAGLTTAGSHALTLSGAGRAIVTSTSTTGGFGIDTTTGLVPVIVAAAQAENVLTGAISVANFLSTIDTSAGATAYTLAAGVVPGQLKKILLRVDNGDATVTGAFAGASTTLTFSDAGEYALLMWDGTDWIALELTSTLNMAHAPVIS